MNTRLPTLLILSTCFGCSSDAEPPGPSQVTAPAPAPVPEPAPEPALEPEPAPAPAPAAENEAPEGGCDIGALVADPDPAGLNVRDAPNGNVLGQLYRETSIQVREQQDNWLRVTDAWDPGREDETLPSGWVAAKLLTTVLKTPDEYGPDAQPMFYDSATSSTAQPIPLPVSNIRLAGCAERRLHITWTDPSGSEQTGWIDPDAHCPSAVTTCP